MLWEKLARSVPGNLQVVPTPVGGAHVAAIVLAVLLAGCGAIVDEEIAATDEPLINAKKTTNPYVVYYCAQSGCCTGTFIGPHALLSSRHCTKKLQADDWISVRRYDRTPDGDLDSNTVKRVLRKKWGTDGLLLIELQDHVGQYTSVCQELFKKKDRLKHYGAGATNKSGSHDDDKLRVSKDGINFSGLYEYKVGPRHGSKGDSGGPYMYDNSVVGVHYDHKWKRSLFSGKKKWDVATNLAEGWVFRHGISGAKRRCKPGRGLTGATGSVSWQLLATVEASCRKIRFGELRWDGTFRGKAGTF